MIAALTTIGSMIGFLLLMLVLAMASIKILDWVLDRFTDIWEPLPDLDLGEWEVEEGEISG